MRQRKKNVKKIVNKSVSKLVDYFKAVPFDTKAIDSSVIKAFVDSLSKGLNEHGCDCREALQKVNASSVLAGVTIAISKQNSEVSKETAPRVSPLVKL